MLAMLAMKRLVIGLAVAGLALAGCTMGVAHEGEITTPAPAASAIASPTAIAAVPETPAPATVVSTRISEEGTATSGVPPAPDGSEAVASPIAVPPTPTLAAPTRAPATATPRPPTATPSSPTATPTAETWWEVRTLLVGPAPESGGIGRLYALQGRVGREPQPAGSVRLLVSDDGGGAWAAFPGGLPAPGCLHNVDMDYAAVDALYASTCQGLYRWRSPGSEWALVSPQETFEVEIEYGRPEVLWAVQSFGRGAAVIRSGDGGVTWAPAATDLDHFTGVAEIGVDPHDPNTAYAIINPKYAGSYLRRGTGQGRWQTMPTPANNTVIDTGMTIDGATGELYVVTTLPPYQLWRSRNPREMDLSRVAWERLHDFGPNVWAHLLASGWMPPPVELALYANLTTIQPLDDAGLIEVGPAVLHQSLDHGQTWTPLPIPTGEME